MAITYIGSDSDKQGANTTQLTMTLPSHQADDLIIVHAFGNSNTCTLTQGGTTNMISAKRYASASHTGECWYKVAESGSETDPTIDIDESVAHTCVVIVLRGCHAVDPMLDVDSKNITADVTPAHDGLEGGADNGATVVVWHSVGSNCTGVAAPSGFTLVQNSITADQNFGLAYDLDYGAASEYTPTDWLNTGTDTGMDGFTFDIAIRPATDQGTLYVGTGALDTGGGTATLTPALATGWVSNDVCILQVFSNGDTTVTDLDTPTGYTAIVSMQTSNTDVAKARYFYKVLQSGDGAPDVTATGLDAAASFAACCSVFRNVDVGIVLDTTAAVTTPVAATTLSNPGVTHVEEPAMICRFTTAAGESNIKDPIRGIQRHFGVDYDATPQVGNGLACSLYTTYDPTSPASSSAIFANTGGAVDYISATIALRRETVAVPVQTHGKMRKYRQLKAI